MYWTLERLLETVPEIVQDVKKAARRQREALDATRDGQPDHLVRLKAADQVMSLAGLKHQGPQVAANVHNTLVIQWQESPSLTSPDRSSLPSISHLSANGHALPSASSTDALESL